MIVLRSVREIDSIRKAGRIAALTLEKLKKHARAGISTAELDAIAGDEILSHNGLPAFKGYKGFPANACISINEEVVHGIPSARKLSNGDIVSIDIGVKYKDYFADAAVTIGIGAISEDAKRLITVTEESLNAGIDKAIPGNRLSDVSCAIQSRVEANGFSVVRAFVGHGIGTKIHEEPEVPNFGRPGTGPRIQQGMVIAIEPMVNAGSFEIEVLKDGWTAVTKDRGLSAHFEHTIAVTGDKAEIMTV